MKIALIAAAIALVPLDLSAATLTVTGVTGEWTSMTGTPPSIKGKDTRSVSWGTGWKSGPQSGYAFKGRGSRKNVANDDFVVGTFTHRNNPISVGSSITGATLKVAFSFFIDTEPGTVFTRVAEFRFGHKETRNGARTCANGKKNGKGVNRNGCADEVTVETNPNFKETFTIEGVNYVFDVSGFAVGESFWTTEEKRNRTRLIGSFTEDRSVTPPPTPVAPVPLPAAGGLLFGSLALIGAAARPRRA